MIASWLGEGTLHRVLEAAERPNLSLKASRFIGALFERYCLDLTRSVYTGDRPPGGGRVHSDQPYGGRRRRQMTSDVAIDLGTDLALIEVVSARLTTQMQVFGNRELLEQNLERMLFKKMKQLGRVIGDLISGEATIPDVDIAHVERIWPVLVTAGELMYTEMLWDQIDARLPVELSAARVQQLSVFDTGDFELLLALVSAGHHLPDVLHRKSTGPYRRLEIARFATDELHTDATLRLPIIERALPRPLARDAPGSPLRRRRAGGMIYPGIKPKPLPWLATDRPVNDPCRVRVGHGRKPPRSGSPFARRRFRSSPQR